MEPVERIERHPDGFVVHTKGGGELIARAVIIATGSQQKRLTAQGEKEFIMRGLCYSALSYAPLFIDKKTVVIGDGELALRSAAELSTVADHVHLVGAGKKALETVLGKKLLKADNVSILEDYQVSEVKGNGFAKQVIVKSPVGEELAIDADGTFVEMGLVPNSQMVAELVDLDEQGCIIVDCGARTSVPGIFAAGDVTNIFAEQVLIAVGEGAKAALSAYEYLLPML